MNFLGASTKCILLESCSFTGKGSVAFLASKGIYGSERYRNLRATVKYSSSLWRLEE